MKQGCFVVVLNKIGNISIEMSKWVQWPSGHVSHVFKRDSTFCYPTLYIGLYLVQQFTINPTTVTELWRDALVGTDVFPGEHSLGCKPSVESDALDSSKRYAALRHSSVQSITVLPLKY